MWACVGAWGWGGGDNSDGMSQGLASLSLDDENERCVALWLKSINLDEYRHKIIDYGYDSMRAAVEALANTPHLLPLLFPGEPP